MFKVILTLVFLLGVLFFSFRLLDVPKGITVDEAAFGYNASLISETLRDENGRFLPIFVLSLDGRDWRQPVMQYLDVIAFKLFGKSLFVLKMVSVLLAAASALLIYFLAARIKNKKFAYLALLIFITSPIILIHSHLALDNISPVPFILIWLIGIFEYERTKSVKFMILSGISLGIGFYAHKSMRSASSVWALLTALYLITLYVKNWGKLTFGNYKPVIFFIAAVLPFFLASPLLEYKYAGAVYGSQSLEVKSLYDFFYFYISNFDLSFLFIKGDSILHHSTGRHGMFLLFTMPLFFLGAYKAVCRREKFFIFLLICFFAGPLFVALAGSVHRASRILFLAPLFSLISVYGFTQLIELKGKLARVLIILLLVCGIFNTSDFLRYYWFEYGEDTSHIFYKTQSIPVYKKLFYISEEKNLIPYISESLINRNGDPGTIEDFSRSLYFTGVPGLKNGIDLPAGSIFLTDDKNIQDADKLESGAEGYYLYLKD